VSCPERLYRSGHERLVLIAGWRELAGFVNRQVAVLRCLSDRSAAVKEGDDAGIGLVHVLLTQLLAPVGRFVCHVRPKGRRPRRERTIPLRAGPSASSAG